MPIFVPPIRMQEEIIKFLNAWEAVIEKTERLIAAKQKQFDWLATHLINQSRYHRGCVSDFTAEVSARNRNSKIDRVLSVTNHSGFVLPEEQFERRVASSNLSNYKIVKGGQYAYNPSRINVGSIARLDKWDIGVLSPMYVVFKLDESRVESDYFLHWLSSHEARQRIKKSAQGSVRETVSFSDLGSIPIPIPSLEKQRKVAEILNTAKQEINILEKLADKYRTQKRGLMQKLLTGEWRVDAAKEVA
jgi:type I restriction enzyme S subunit